MATDPSCLLISRQPVCVNLDIYAGDDLVLQVTVTDENNEPIDLSAATAKAQVRETAAAAKVLGEFVCTITAPNIIDLELAGSATATFPAEAVWDLQITQSGKTTTLVYGTVTTTPEVTR